MSKKTVKQKVKFENGSMVFVLPMDKAKQLEKAKLPQGASVFVIDSVAATIMEDICAQLMREYLLSLLK